MVENKNPVDHKEISEHAFRRRSRRSFLAAGASAIAGLAGWRWVLSRPQDGGTPWPLRRSFEFNEKVSRTFFDPNRIPPLPEAPPPGTEARVNGDLGLKSPLNLADWRLHVEPDDPMANFPRERPRLLLTLDDLARLPQTRTQAQFKCIEGWSMNISYKGIRFSDFLATYKLGTRSGAPLLPDVTPRSDWYLYVGLETPDKGYYVSIDMESMLHPQTVLATHLNDVPLTAEHGAPLRLIIPIKYGIKSLKRIGRIFFSDQRPPDYWAERGYDWYSGH